MALVQFSGLASGIDSQSLIEALLTQQRKVRIEPLQNKITELQEANSALSELKTLLTTLRSKADKFRTLNGGALSRLANSSDESVVTASASNSAQPGTYSLTVTQLAKNGTLSLASQNQTYSSGSSQINSAMAIAGVASVTTGQGTEAETVDVTVDNTTTLDQFVTDYNNQATKSVATVINVGTSSSPNYQIMISSNEQGEDSGYLDITLAAEITTAGVGAFDDNTLSQATNAEFTLDGVGETVTRSSNSVSDLISGLTFALQGTGTSTITVANDKTSSTKTLREFVEAYNAVVEFIKENDQVTVESSDEGNTNTFAPLAKMGLDNSILSAIRQSFSSSALTSGDIRIMADLGVTTNRDGTISFDEELFESALDSSDSGVAELLANLGEDLAAVDGTIDQFTRFNGLIDISSNSQTEVIKRNNDRISVLEQQLARQEESLIARFAKLEAIMGKMQSQQASLGGLLAGLAG